MAGKKSTRGGGSRSGAPTRRPTQAPAAASRRKLYLAIAGGVLAMLVAVVVGFVALGSAGSGAAPSRVAGETIHQGQGGQWTNVTADRLAEMLTHKDFTFVNVKTPYIGEIDGTDLYIPYDQLSARTSQLPAAKTAKILV